MEENLSKIKPRSALTLQKKFLIIAVILFLASLFLTLFAQLVNTSPSLQTITNSLFKTSCFIILAILFRKHLEILLLPLLFSLLQTGIHLFSTLNVMTLCSIAVEIAFITILIFSIYKNISLTVAKIAVLVRFAFCIVKTVINFFSPYGIDISYVLNSLSSVSFVAAIFVIFFFITKEESKGAWANWSEVKLAFIIIGVVIGIVVVVKLFTNDPTTTYYIDYNGNGKEDWGEAQFYEDKNGTHWLN